MLLLLLILLVALVGAVYWNWPAIRSRFGGPAVAHANTKAQLDAAKILQRRKFW